ncbi:MAG: dTDP-4-dehydrorhamnose 3,5-epimerase [Phycisphaerae bacterium]|nr:dTDP-4-dehydrorhamnose 3,5-epimerase [Phycisphaerae bacterium]
MNISSLSIPDVRLIEPRVFGDSRGFFLETWSAREFQSSGLDIDFVQDNWSRSTRGVLRGLHYQLQHPQGKLVRCVAGEVFDVAVDLRRSSLTFGKWVGCILSEENKRAMWIPPGFAHGFVTLSDSADFQYKCSDIYHPESERTLRWNDPEVGIEWPDFGEVTPELSTKDLTTACSLAEAEVFE